jgi:hypothetical protein
MEEGGGIFHTGLGINVPLSLVDLSEGGKHAKQRTAMGIPFARLGLQQQWPTSLAPELWVVGSGLPGLVALSSTRAAKGNFVLSLLDIFVLSPH